MKSLVCNDLEVRGILSGTKTQIRRVIKPQPEFIGNTADGRKFYDLGKYGKYFLSDPRTNKDFFSKSPFKPGDRLYVREATRSYYMRNFITGEPTTALCGQYTADNEPVLNEHGFDFAWWYSRKSCPAICMPKWASRITLGLTEVRVQRLQDISEQDACAEGVDFGNITDEITGEIDRDATEAFESLWDSIHAKRRAWRYARLGEPGYPIRKITTGINESHSWESNPFVFALTFRRVEK